MPARARDQAAAFVLGDRAYVAGGMTCAANDCAEQAELWQYEPRSDRWMRKADMPDALSAAACFVLNGSACLTGGRSGGTLSNDVLVYDPESDRWTRKTPFPGPSRIRAVGFSDHGHGYIATGIQAISPSSVTVLRDLWEYDAPRDRWTRQPDVRGPARGAAVAFVAGSRIFTGTGLDSTRAPLADLWSVSRRD